MRITIKLEGLDRLNRILDDQSDLLKRRIVSAAASGAAEKMRQESPVKTGTLKRSIRAGKTYVQFRRYGFPAFKHKQGRKFAAAETAREGAVEGVRKEVSKSSRKF